MTEHRPAPPVTITGGPTAAALPEVTDDEPDRDPDPRRVRRRRLTLVLLGLTLLSALGVAELRHSRAMAEAARAGHRGVAWELQLSVHNNGPRDVEILAVELPGVQLDGPAALRAGEDSGLTLAGHHSCTGDPVEPGPRSLPVEVRIEAGPLRVCLIIFDAALDTRQYAISCDEGRADQPAGRSAD